MRTPGVPSHFPGTSTAIPPTDCWYWRLAAGILALVTADQRILRYPHVKTLDAGT